MLALAHSTVNDVWITRMRFIFIDKVGGARGTLFTSEYCPGGQYSRGDIIHSDNGLHTHNVQYNKHGGHAILKRTFGPRLRSPRGT